jgi:uncharacterized protein YjbJ (UPF0337 family)
MEKEQATGKFDVLKGKAKQAIGKATGDSSLEAEGAVDEAKGHVKQAYGGVKDAIKKSDKQAGSDLNDK